MHEILSNLGAGARVLDLGCGGGSFRQECCPQAMVVRLDREPPESRPPGLFVQADAAGLPFPDASFDAIICNHGLEHMASPAVVLEEMGRAVRPLYASFVYLRRSIF